MGLTGDNGVSGGPPAAGSVRVCARPSPGGTAPALEPPLKKNLPTNALLVAACVAAPPAFAQPAVDTPATSGDLMTLPQQSVPAPEGPIDPLALPVEPPLGEPEAAPDFFDALKGGKIKVNLRGRYEYAGFSSVPNQSNATTLRTRIGYLTGDWLGLQGYIEFEDIRAGNNDIYNAAGLNGVTGRPVIADPEVTELNELWLGYALPTGETGSPIALNAKVGRQVIALDDQRFVGHVGWRQDNQTFDAGTFTTDLGLEGFELFYGYVNQANRIFAEARDFQSDSHLLNASYQLPGGKKSPGKLSGFAYLLDFENGAGASSDTYGLRLAGKLPLDDAVSLLYQASWATQSEAGDNPVGYTANYALGDVALQVESIGTFGAGYELLGSDDGVAAFQTPLGTNHKFNGFADQFLVTPAAGLQDIYFYAKAGFLPKGTSALVAYHLFQPDEGSDDYGSEIDAVLTQKLHENLTVGGKAAYFFGENGRPDVTRLTFDLTLAF